MAKKIVKKNIKKTKSSNAEPFSIFWKKENYYLMVLGVAVIIAGYIFMSMGNWDSFQSLDISPMLLGVGYVVILPTAILYKGKNKPENSGEKALSEEKN